MLLIGITLLVTCYSEARIIILSTLVVIGIKFIDNNTVVHTISSKINNKSVTFIVVPKQQGITSPLVAKGLLVFRQGTLINYTFRSSYR